MQIRQGDVLLISRPVPRRGAKRLDLAGLRVPGERTGHAHVLAAEVYEHAGTRLLALREPGVLTHEEHAPVAVPAGWWEPILQREFVPSSAPARRARFD